MQKRGYFFLIDAFVGAAVISIALLLIMSYQPQPPSPVQNIVFSQDYMNLFFSVEMRDLIDPYVVNLTLTGEINNTRNTILEQITEFYYRQRYKGCSYCMEIATNMTKKITDGVLPEQYGFSFVLNDTLVYNRSMETYSTARLVVAQQKIAFFKVNDSFMFGPVLAEVKIWQ
jgi:hypothetical protein